ITDSTFYLPYLPEGEEDSIRIAYTKNELLEVIVNRILNHRTMKEVPYVITEIIQGHHRSYLVPKFDHLFKRYPAPDGMRISVYCAEQQYYHNEAIIRESYQIYPYLAGFRINDVYEAMCDCWDVPPVEPAIKRPFYSPAPILLADGLMDAACSPLYIATIQHYMPNAQTF